jgi:hypothetical protein
MYNLLSATFIKSYNVAHKDRLGNIIITSKLPNSKGIKI